MKVLTRATRIAGVLLGAAVLTVFAAPEISGAVPPATLYAATSAAGTGDCSSAGNACTLSTALTDVVAGGTIDLVSPGTEGTSSTYYAGGFSISTSGTSPSSPVTIQPASAGLDPILDGGGTQQVLSVGDMYLDLDGLTVQNGHAPNGAGIADNAGGTLAITGSTFSDNSAVATAGGTGDGGAIDVGDGTSNSGTLTITGSTFSSNSATYDGGAVTSGANHGTGSLTITDSTFSANGASDGGAVDSGDFYGTDTLTVTGSTFSTNFATADGGAIDNGDVSGSSTLTVTGSTFSSNTSSNNGGAIDSGDNYGTGTLTVTGSTFSSNSSVNFGGAIDNGAFGATGTATVSFSTFSGNSATSTGFPGGHGGAIDNGDYDSTGSGTLTATSSTFTGNSAALNGEIIDNGDDIGAGAVTVATDVFAGGCDQGSGASNTWTDHGYSAGSDATCFNGGTANDDSAGSELPNLLGPLANNGGPTQTIALDEGNPAVGIIPNPTTGLCPVAADQRGDASPTGQPCDAGAVQLSVVPSSAYTAVTPYRICDTRGADGLSGTNAQCAGQRLSAGQTLTIHVSGTNPSGTSSGGVPSSGVNAVVLNVTATGEAAQGYLTVWPADKGQPTASSLNYRANKTVPNLVTVGLSTSGEVSLYSLAATDLVVDVEGYYAAASGTAGLFNSLTPYRICDTRGTDGLSGTNAQCAGHTLAGSQTLAIQVTGTNPSGSSSGGVPSSGVSAVVLNVTAIGHGTGYLTVFPQGLTAPTASNLNFSSGQVVPNRVIVPVSASGRVSLTTNTSVDVAVDVNGWFTDGSSPAQTGALFVATTPARICDTRNNGNATPCAGHTLDGPAASYDIAVAGQGPVPASGVVAVVANLTAADTTAQSYLTAWPKGQSQPTASDLNWVSGLTVPNMAVVGLGSGGDITVYVANGDADVIVDVTGWYVEAS